MNVAIVCVSEHHQNTRRVAEAIAAPLEAKIYTVAEAAALDLRHVDLLGLGSGVYFGRLHPSLLRWVAQAPLLPGRCFVFSTAGLAFLRPLWHQSLLRRLCQRHCDVVGQLSCPGWDTVGPLALIGGLRRGRPNAKDLAAAAEFGRRLARGDVGIMVSKSPRSSN